MNGKTFLIIASVLFILLIGAILGFIFSHKNQLSESNDLSDFSSPKMTTFSSKDFTLLYPSGALVSQQGGSQGGAVVILEQGDTTINIESYPYSQKNWEDLTSPLSILGYVKKSTTIKDKTVDMYMNVVAGQPPLHNTLIFLTGDKKIMRAMLTYKGNQVNSVLENRFISVVNTLAF